MYTVERLIFRKYLKADLQDVRLEQAVPYPENEIVLSVNPKQITWDKPRIIEKTRTQKPGRFVFADWGMDTIKIKITGQTGSMLPTEDDRTLLFDIINRGESSPGNTAQDWTLNELMEYIPYSMLLDVNKNYKKFKDLERMYLNFDMNEQVMVLIIANEYRRVVMTNFSFTQSTENPWHWEYTIDLEQVSLEMGESLFLRNQINVEDQHPEEYQIP